MLIARALGFFILGLVMAYGYSLWQSSSENQIKYGERQPSAIDTVRILQWTDVKCLDSKKLETIYKRVQFQGATNSSVCDSSLEGRFNKFLSFISQPQFQLKEAKWGDLAKMFNDPIGYFERMRVRLSIDPKLSHALAQTMDSVGIFLGLPFFNLDPIAAVSVFLHETYHNSPEDPKHERCKGGDVPQSKGGCDAVFTLRASEKRGAYSISVAYLMAQALENSKLSHEQREQLLAEAFLILATRFNSGFDQIAAIAETLTFLDLKGQIWIYHPWLKMVRQIPDPEKLMQKKPFIQMDFQHQKQGIFAINQDKKLYEWSYLSPLRRYYTDVIGEQEEILDATKLYLSSQEYAHTSVLKADRRIYAVSFNFDLQRYELKYLQPNTEKLTHQPKKISTYDFFAAGVLDEAGEIWKIAKGGRGLQEIFREEMYNDKDLRYESISGGLYTDRFLGVTSKGELYQREGASLKIWKGVPRGLNKVSEGYLNYYGRTDAKEVWYWPRNKKEFDANDKVMIRVPFEVFDMSLVRKLVAVTGETLETNKKICGHPISFYDPFWPDMAWTVADESLILGPIDGTEDDCRVVRGNVKSAKLVKRSEKEDKNQKSDLRPVDLEIEFLRKTPIQFRSWK
jgi:hypothetical protein